jgi:DNA-binding transcriptional LysR family regulator
MRRKFGHLGDVELFQATVDAGSFSAAAVALGMSPSAISRAVERLERHLGLPLLRRTTRSLSLTDAGRTYLERSLAAFALLDDAEQTARGDVRDVSGRVRLSVPTTWGHHRAAARLSAFAQRYPDVAVELSITNRNVDLVSEGFDAAVRRGNMPDSGLVARPLEDAPLCLVASSAYLERRGVPRTVADLESHDCLPFILPSTGKRMPWELLVDGENIEWTPPARISVSEDVLGCVSLAEHGAGIAQTFDFVVETSLAAGRLNEVLPETRGRSRRFSLIYVPHRQLPPATRALIDFLTVAPNDDPATT